MYIIKLKEEHEHKEIALRAQFKKFENEKDDIQFLANQKDFKIQELEKAILDMKAKLDKALTKSYHPQANEIIKGLKKDSNTQENVVKKQDFVVSKAIENVDPNRGNTPF